jgi:hypothetical protein
MKSRARAAFIAVGVSVAVALVAAPVAHAGIAYLGPYYYYSLDDVERASVPDISFTTGLTAYWYANTTVKVCDRSADGYRARAKVTYYDKLGNQWGGATIVIDATEGKGTCATRTVNRKDLGVYWAKTAKLSVGRYDGDTGREGYVNYWIPMP